MQKLSFEPNKEIHIKVTRKTEYGDRYKLFVINKGSYNQNFDLNCDGKTDSTLVIPDDKTAPIYTSMDSNGDGQIDIILVDANRDGKVNFSYLDTDHDGSADQKGIHTSGNAIPDRVEPFG